MWKAQLFQQKKDRGNQSWAAQQKRVVDRWLRWCTPKRLSNQRWRESTMGAQKREKQRKFCMAYAPLIAAYALMSSGALTLHDTFVHVVCTSGRKIHREWVYAYKGKYIRKMQEKKWKIPFFRLSPNFVFCWKSCAFHILRSFDPFCCWSGNPPCV